MGAEMSNKKKSKAFFTCSKGSQKTQQKQDFASIYEMWTKSHDEKNAISKRYEDSSNEDITASETSINALRQMRAQDVLDLHNLVLDEALLRVKTFLDDAKSKGYRKVLVITGKGLHSQGGEAVLRPAIKATIANHPAVREYFVPKALDGGSGAFAVILKAKTKTT